MAVLVRFRTGDGTYAIPVANALEVRPSSAVVALPAPAPGVAGVLERGDETLPVIRILGGGDKHILVVAAGEEPVGLLVDEVLGVSTLPDSELRPPPPGQDEALVDAVVHEDGGLTFVVDVAELVRQVQAREMG